VDDPPTGGAGARERRLSFALVLHAEVIQKIKRVAMPAYGRLNSADLNSRLAQIHRLCTELQQSLEEGRPMPSKPIKNLKNRYWTAEGDNGSDAPIHVGVFRDKGEAHVWATRQNETQRQQEWGRGSAGPMTFTPKPLYADGTTPPEPDRLILPERQWDHGDGDGRNE
jgi:hypothetical protein